MSDDDYSAQRKAAYAKLEEAIAALVSLPRDDDDDDRYPEVAVDAVLLIGTQFIDEDGDRSGCLTICPRGGWQPGYITAGLIAQALATVTAP